MKKTLIVLGLVAVLAFGVTFVYAHGPGYGPGPGRRGESCWGPGGTGKGSTLTPEQESRFQELRQKFFEETAQLREAIVSKRQELHSLWTNPNADPKAIVEKERELRDLQNQMRDKSIEFKLEARNSLTPEQIEEFGQDRGMGRGFGPGHMRGYGHRFDRGYGKGPGSGYGMGPGSGACN